MLSCAHICKCARLCALVFACAGACPLFACACNACQLLKLVNSCQLHKLVNAWSLLDNRQAEHEFSCLTPAGLREQMLETWGGGGGDAGFIV